MNSSPTSAINYNNLYHSMSQDYELCQQMLAKLQIEKFALENSDIELLEQTINAKAQIVSQLSEVQTYRDQTLDALGIEVGFRGLKIAFSQSRNSASNEQLTLLSKLEDLLKNIADISHINSILIYNSFNQTNKILDVMLDRNHEHPATYGKNGFTTNINYLNDEMKTKA
jgi:hypothetical protein